MSRTRKLSWAALAVCCFVGVAVYALSKGILVGEMVEWHSTRGYKGDRPYTFNTAMLRCRYLYLSGAEVSEPIGPVEQASCSFFGSS